MTISDILQKVGIKSIDDLTPAEKITFSQWQAILTKPETSIKDLKEILGKELARAHAELRKHENTKDKDSFYKAYATLCDFILTTVSGPEEERKQLTAILKQKYGLE
jgi:hypothetical protein